ncbi:MAG: aspartate racemase, aspartate racemase, partial [Candidatus Saccharibacteria bacterium]|nr:aspartate racemase, aspartate racemase [Candidatus Saccharibacteria bacterium]
VGVIGGLGPETTANFYLEVIFRCQQLNDNQRPSVVIGSVPLLFEIERDLIAHNTGIERYIPFLQEEAKKLEKSGVDFLVMPCNSLHVFIEEIREAVSIPVLSIVEEAIKYLNSKDIKKVGLISTSATIENKVYESKLSESGIEYVTPIDQQRSKIDSIIQRLVSGEHLEEDRKFLIDTADSISEKDVSYVALACTDLQLLNPESEKVEIFDTMKILADSTVAKILS